MKHPVLLQQVHTNTPNQIDTYSFPFSPLLSHSHSVSASLKYESVVKSVAFKRSQVPCKGREDCDRPSKAEMFGQLVRAKLLAPGNGSLRWYGCGMNEGMCKSGKDEHACGVQVSHVLCIICVERSLQYAAVCHTIPYGFFTID